MLGVLTGIVSQQRGNSSILKQDHLFECWTASRCDIALFLCRGGGTEGGRLRVRECRTYLVKPHVNLLSKAAKYRGSMVGRGLSGGVVAAYRSLASLHN